MAIPFTVAGGFRALVKMQPETVVDASLVRGNIDIQVQCLVTVNGELMQSVLASAWNDLLALIHVEVVVGDLLA